MEKHTQGNSKAVLNKHVGKKKSPKLYSRIPRRAKRYLTIRHYWSRADDIPYTGDAPRIAIEALLVIMLLPIVIYTNTQPGLELFFAGFLIPCAMLCVGFIQSLFVFWREGN